MAIPFLDLKPIYGEIRAELDAAYREVMESGWYILGAQVAAFEQEVVRQGAQTFFTVVTIGPHRAALADVYASETALRKGDLVRLDLGCVYQGYRSDISRTAVLGAPTDKQRRYYDAIRDGEIAAIAAMKPGVPVSQIFEIGMQVTRERGSAFHARYANAERRRPAGRNPARLTSAAFGAPRAPSSLMYWEAWL